jgi:hypothetical protein
MGMAQPTTTIQAISNFFADKPEEIEVKPVPGD